MAAVLQAPSPRVKKPAPSPRPAEVERPFGEQSVEELRLLLADCRARTADNFRRAAQIMAALEEAGDDVSDLDPIWLDWMRRIAAGQLLPTLLEGCLGVRDDRLRVLTNLSIPDQRRLARDGRVEVAIWYQGRIDKRPMRPTEMAADQFHRVFADGRIRSFQEQRTELEQTAPPSSAPPKPRPVPASAITADPVTGSLVVDRRTVPVREALRAIGELAPVNDDGPRRPGKSVTIDASLHDSLSRIAATGNTTVRRLVERAITEVFFPEGNETHS